VSQTEPSPPSFAPTLRVLLLYGSLREGSASRLLTLHAARVLKELGAEPRVFHAHSLPLYGSQPEHPAADELRELCVWADAQLWCTPEMHGTLTGVLKNQLDWIPLEWRGQSLTSHKPVALLQVCGGERSFNALNTMRLIARHLHMIAIPRQLSLARAQLKFSDSGALVSDSDELRFRELAAELTTLARRLAPRPP
jgi:arsenical resistance protein ArsH